MPIRRRRTTVRAFMCTLSGAYALVLAGCASTGDSELATQSLNAGSDAAAPQSVPAGKSRLVLSRPSGMLYMAVPASVKVNGNKVADLYGGNSHTLDIAPGKVSIMVDSWNYPGSWTDELAAAAGVTYEIEVGPREDGVGTAVMFGAIGGAIEAQNNPKSGLFQWKVTKRSSTQVATAGAAAKQATAASSKAKISTATKAKTE